jgi:hypothetical protein
MRACPVFDAAGAMIPASAFLADSAPEGQAPEGVRQPVFDAAGADSRDPGGQRLG